VGVAAVRASSRRRGRGEEYVFLDVLTIDPYLGALGCKASISDSPVNLIRWRKKGKQKKRMKDVLQYCLFLKHRVATAFLRRCVKGNDTSSLKAQAS
jgi:hypothetical protein